MPLLDQLTTDAIQKNCNFDDKELLLELSQLFNDKPEVCKFLYLYGQYCELTDDMVDEVTNPDIIEKAGLLRMELDHCEYWQQHKVYLWAVERLIHLTYFDCVKWEKAEEEWKRRDAKALSHCAYMMLFSVILIEFGYDKLKEISLRFREHAHKKHLNDPI